MPKPRFARLDEADTLKTFIREQWAPDHVLARSDALFDWQHRDIIHNRYNFVLAEDSGIRGILGFIPLSRHDKNLASSDTAWLTLWKVRPEMGSGLGVQLLWALERLYPTRWIGTVGLNIATRPIYTALGYTVGRLGRYFLLNNSMKSFRLAVVPQGFTPPPACPSETRANLLTRDHYDVEACEVSQPQNIGPTKSIHQFRARYLNHPFYHYDMWKLVRGAVTGILAVRVCTHDGANALRLVDFIGDPAVIAGAHGAFAQMLKAYGAEYLDFYCSNVDEEARAAGLMNVSMVPGLVLPGYFEPFVSDNVDLLYSLKGPDCRHIVCKGDADQDRPNLLTSI